MSNRITPDRIVLFVHEAQGLFAKLTNAKNRRLVMLSEGGHQMSLEKNRVHLIGEVQHFLEEPLGP